MRVAKASGASAKTQKGNDAADVRVALLRGINVGKAKRVSMAQLRQVVEDLGYTQVRTLLNSGNVVFTVPANRRGDPAARIEQAIAGHLGVTTRVIVLTAAEVKAMVERNALARIADNPSLLLTLVLPDLRTASALRDLARQDWGPEALALGRRAAYLWCPGGTIKSRLAAAVNRALKEVGTARNMATMTKLRAMMME